MDFVRWVNASLLGAAGIILLALVMQLTAPPAATITWMPEGLFTPILGFEYLHSAEQATQFFHGDSVLLAAMKKSVWLDWPFLISYGIFLSFCSVACYKLTRQPLVLMGAVLAVCGALFDFFENQLLLEIIDAQQNAGFFDEYGRLRQFVTAKFVSLSLSSLALLPALTRFGLTGKIFNVFALIAFVASLISVASPAYWAEITAYSMSVSWLALTVIAIRASRYHQPEEAAGSEPVA